eukprot:superscaffoldBa00001925_g12533
MWTVLMENAKLHLVLFPKGADLRAASPALEPTLPLKNALDCVLHHRRTVVELLLQHPELQSLRWSSSLHLALVPPARVLLHWTPQSSTNADANRASLVSAQHHLSPKLATYNNCMIICDAAYIISNVEAKWPGSVHDSRIYRESNLSNKLQRGEFDGLLLSDRGYPCQPRLLTLTLTLNQAPNRTSTGLVAGREPGLNDNHSGRAVLLSQLQSGGGDVLHIGARIAGPTPAYNHVLDYGSADNKHCGWVPHLRVHI